jgi:hypothetical protein
MQNVNHQRLKMGDGARSDAAHSQKTTGAQSGFSPICAGAMPKPKKSTATCHQDKYMMRLSIRRVDS